MTLLFTLLVVLGFIFRFVGCFPVNFPATAFAWGCWMVAAILWAIPNLGGVA